MKTLIIFDSYFGNTKLIAEAIGKEFGEETKVITVADFQKEDLTGLGLLIVGSPIRGWKASPPIQEFLTSLSQNQLQGVKAASFDTRVRIFFHGDAAKSISQKLRDVGAEIIAEPQGFYVKGKEGPLEDAEIEKAIQWAKTISSKL
jgi:flavodoxin